MATTAVQNVDMTEVWKQYKADPNSVELRNRLVERYTAIWCATTANASGQRLPEGVDLDDLISAGIFGLMDAIDAFDLDRGVKFETYCVPRIRGAMLDELRTMDWVPRLVRSQGEQTGRSNQASGDQIRSRPTNR
jgi:RNA polymerase sigma factor FliA